MVAATPTTRSPATGAPIAAETVAYIDIGTNSVRLMVVRFAPDHSWTVLSMQKETVRLGEGEFGEVRQLQPAAMERAATVCARFADLARAHGATRFVTVATAATREARNAHDFVRLLRETAGLEVHVVSGREEARLVYLGLLSRVHVDDRALVIDIGGGSTEVAVGDGSGADIVESISLGAVRLATEGPAAGRRRPVRRRRLRGSQALRPPHVAAHAEGCRTARGRRLRHLGHHREPRRHRGAALLRPRGGTGRAAHAEGPARGGEAPPRDDRRRAALGAGTGAGAGGHHRRRRGHPGRR